MRVLVCGSRHFHDYLVVRDVLDEYFDLHGFRSGEDFFIIEGGARGVDNLARQYAITEDINYQTFPANWDKYGKAAGPIRNKQMLDEGKPDLVIAFLAEGSKGTANMIKQAKEAGVEVKVINYA